MNTLDWVVNELISTLEEYIRDNKQYFEYLQSQSADKSAVASNANEGDAISQPTPTIQGTNVAAADELSYTSIARLKVESLLFTKVQLKSEKYSEAVAFVAQVKAIINRDMKYDKDDIRKKIVDLSKVLDDEVAKMTEILREHGQPRGTYDALLRIFADVLNWLKREENLDVLAVAIKYEMLGDKHKNFKEAVKIGNTSYFVPLPLTQHLVTYLARQMLSLHLDRTRDLEKERIPYERMLPEVQAENIIDKCRFHVLAIDQHTNQNNSKDSIPVRQNNNLIVLNCLRMECSDIYSTMQGYILPTKNAFMVDMLAQLKSWSVQADERIRERVKSAIEVRQERQSNAPSSTLS